ncbi:MAG: hypothetical protein HY719_04430 [Planctomycetes bacterium]|nr:hypothetical protein [Planctomycetota bacterium]
MTPPDDRRLRALISLLDDDAPAVWRAAARGLVECGPPAWTALRPAALARVGRLSGRAEEVCARIAGEETVARIHQFARRPPELWDLEEAALMLCRLGDPTLDPLAVMESLDILADRVRDTARSGGDRREEPLDALRRVLFEEAGFSGASVGEGAADDRDSFLHEVLERKRGLPIALSLLTMLVGKRAGLAIDGIALPGHFIVQVQTPGGGRVFLDPFRNGRRVTIAEMMVFVRALGAECFPDDFAPAEPGAVVLRMVRNLLAVYTRRGDTWRLAAATTCERILVRAVTRSLRLEDRPGE